MFDSLQFTPTRMQHSKTYYRVRTVVRIVFWTAFILGVCYVIGKIGGGGVN